MDTAEELQRLRRIELAAKLHSAEAKARGALFDVAELILQALGPGKKPVTDQDLEKCP